MHNFGQAHAELAVWIITVKNSGGELFLRIFNFLRQVEGEIVSSNNPQPLYIRGCGFVFGVVGELNTPYSPVNKRSRGKG